MLEDELKQLCNQQCKTAAMADMADTDLMQFMENALADLDGYVD